MTSSGRQASKRQSLGGLAGVVRRMRSTVRSMTSCCTSRHQQGAAGKSMAAAAAMEQLAPAAPLSHDRGDSELVTGSTRARARGDVQQRMSLAAEDMTGGSRHAWQCQGQGQQRRSYGTFHGHRTSAPSHVIFDIYTLHRIQKASRLNYQQSASDGGEKNNRATTRLQSLFLQQSTQATYTSNDRSSNNDQAHAVEYLGKSETGTIGQPVMHSTPKSSCGGWQQETGSSIKYSNTQHLDNNHNVYTPTFLTERVSQSPQQRSISCTTTEDNSNYLLSSKVYTSPSGDDDFSLIVPRDGDVLTSFRRAPPPQRMKRQSPHANQQHIGNNTTSTMELSPFNI